MPRLRYCESLIHELLLPCLFILQLFPYLIDLIVSPLPLPLQCSSGFCQLLLELLPFLHPFCSHPSDHLRLLGRLLLQPRPLCLQLSGRSLLCLGDSFFDLLLCCLQAGLDPSLDGIWL